MSAGDGDDGVRVGGDDERGDRAYHAFWADEVADRVEARDPEEPVVVKGGVSPSGVPHAGHVNEALRGYYVASVLRERDHDVRQVFTSDDRDPLRSIPYRLMTLDGEYVERDGFDVGALGRNLGRPLTDVPDPLGCCDSFGAHQTALLRQAVDAVGVPVDFYSATALYEDGAFADVAADLLARPAEVRALLAEFQDSVDADGDYWPFRPRCESCGIVTGGVRSFDADTRTVRYVCEDIEAGDRTIEGCGHEGVADLTEGKLPWRFEWPAQWAHFRVDFEPFGKDHAEGSWPSGQEIARDLLDVEPPEPLVYEWFTLDGAALSSSSGNVITAGELLELVESDALRYFFAKEPRKQRDLAVASLDGLVDEFDRFERAYFRGVDAADPDQGAAGADPATAERAYPYVLDPRRVPAAATSAADDPGTVDATLDRVAAADPDPADFGRLRAFLEGVFRERVRVPYRFAAVLGMTERADVREEIARREGHLPDDAPAWAVDLALDRVDHARAWADRTGNRFDYRVERGALPDVDVDGDVAAALAEVASVVANGGDGEAVQGELYEAADRHGVEAADVFEAGYRLFFGDDEGPRLGPFLADLDREFVVARLRRER
ncbi:lysine--tRNA ligase [Halobacteriales archaeon SW_5_70_135]|nr:MAG: lysine--tRNA ligase [Halobacteriales archaeon SW_5_70_135]